MNARRTLPLIVLLVAGGCRGEKPSATPPTPPAAGDRTDVVEAPAPAWVEVAPEGAGFRASFPEEPKHQAQRVATPSGLEAPLRQWVVEDELGRGTFMVSVGPLGARVEDGGDPARTLARIAASQAVGAGGREVVEDKVLEGLGAPARQVVVRLSKGGLAGAEVRLRLVAVGEQLYQVLAMARDAAGRAAAERFLRGFSLTDTAGGAAGGRAGDAASWTLQAAPGGAFRVALPGRAEVIEAARGVTPWGARAVRGLTARSSAPAARYAAREITLAAPEAEGTRHALLDTWQAAVTAAAPAGAAVKRVSVRVAGLPGRALTVTRGDAVVARWLGLVGQGRFYELSATAEGGGAVAEREAGRLFDSFSVAPSR